MANVRDIGGWVNNNGKKIKRGKIIRGARTNAYENTPYYTENGYQCLTKSLHIKGEIDLRHSGDDYGQTHNFIDESYPYLKAPFTTCNYILPSFKQSEPIERQFDKNTPSSFKKIFSFLSDESNYPVYIHCNGGADRTGTICMIIEAVLDLPLDSIYKDIELTSFSASGRRWRSDIGDDITFTKTGVMQDDKLNYVAFGKCINDLWEEYGKGKTFKEAVVNYLKSVCGVSDEEINALNKIMLG